MKPILLIRPDHNRADAEALASFGLSSTICPLQQIVPADSPEPARQLAARLGTCDESTWLIVTSPRTWDQWTIAVPDLDALLVTALARGLKVVAVGAKTAHSLPAAVQERCVNPPGISSEGLLRFLLDAPAGTALIPASAGARSVLRDGLPEAGWQVFYTPIYRSIALPDARLPELSCLGGVLIRSPSAASALAAHLPDECRLPIFSVGPITTARCRDLSWSPMGIDATDAHEVAKAIARHAAEE